MTIRNLEQMFAPRSVAFIGASSQAGSVGKTVTDNLLSAGFSGSIWLVNPRHTQIGAVSCYADIDSLPGVPDLAIIATPAATIPALIAQLGARGTRAVVVITAGVVHQEMLDAAQPYCLRIIGPNCFGLMLPGCGLNGSFAHLSPAAGNLAFISQSGAVISATIDWASARNIGFSHIVSLGNMADVDVGDVLNYLAGEDDCHAILMYLEQITNAHKFMAAARAASLRKPVIVIKAGRHAEGAKAATSHTGALAGADAVYDAAFRATGLLRVTELEDLFAAAEILSRDLGLHGNRLAILTNGGGAGVLAVDRLIDMGGELPTLQPATVTALDAVLPSGWSKANPVDMVGDADPARYQVALETLLNDQGCDAVLVIHCPTALAPAVETAQACLVAAQAAPAKPVLGAWLGGAAAQRGRDLLIRRNIPAFATPEEAIRGFSCLKKWQDVKKTLNHAPVAPALNTDAASALVRPILDAAIASKRTLLSEAEAKDILSAYGVPVVPTFTATTPAEVFSIAENLLQTYPRLVVKLLSATITHKSDVGGVVLRLESAAAAQQAAQTILDKLGDAVDGFTVQPMIDRKAAYELLLGIANDPTFGAVILFGAGGTGAELIADRSVMLPPLDRETVSAAMAETRIFRLLKGYRHEPAAAIDAIENTLLALSALVGDYPEIAELDINPLLADEHGVVALDARIVLKKQV